MDNVVAVIMAGGKGSRLYELTKLRAKPAVPFAGKYKIIDFAIASVIHSEISDIKILTQYGSRSLDRHIKSFGFSSPIWGKRVECIPPQRIHSDWYTGTADAVYQNLDFIKENKEARRIVILAGDHIFNIDFRQVARFHDQKKSKFTVCALKMPVAEAAGNFGVLEVDDDFKVIGFSEKPIKPKEIPGQAGFCLASIGNYFADLDFISDLLKIDAENDMSDHDFGNDIIPILAKSKESIFAYDCLTNNIPGQSGFFWRDVGRIGIYHATHMDLLQLEPELNIHNEHWPLITFPDGLPPAKEARPCTCGGALVSGGCVRDNSFINMSVFGRNVKVVGSELENSIFFDNVHIENAKIKNAIIDEGVIVPPGEEIGFDREKDQDRFPVRDGIVIVPYGFVF